LIASTLDRALIYSGESSPVALEQRLVDLTFTGRTSLLLVIVIDFEINNISVAE